MPLFDRTARRLAAGPTLLLGAEPGDEVHAALRSYDLALRAGDGGFAFGNGVRLHGPVSLTADLAAKAGLRAGMASAYYAGIAGTGTSGTRQDHAKWQDAERLVRGLAARLGGTVHAGRARMALNLASSVYSSERVTADQVISVLQQYTDDGCSRTRTRMCGAPISWSQSRSAGS